MKKLNILIVFEFVEFSMINRQFLNKICVKGLMYCCKFFTITDILIIVQFMHYVFMIFHNMGFQ